MKRIKKNSISVFAVILFLGIVMPSCGNSHASSRDKEKQIGLVKEKSIGNMIFRLQYRPAEEMMKREVADLKTQAEKDSVRNSYLGSKYFVYEITADAEKGGNAADYGAYDLQEYLKRSEEFSFKMGEDLMLLVGNDTLYPSLYHHEKGYELAHSQKFLIAFPYEKAFSNDTVTFIHNDTHFQLGLIKMRMVLKEQ